jgi:hypothetical protein
MEIRDGYITLPWPHRLAGPYAVQIRMEELGDRFEVVEIALGSVRNNLPITGRLLRQVRVAELAAEVAELFQRLDISKRLEPGEPLNAAEMEAESPGWRARRDEAFAAEYAAARREREAIAAVPGAQRRHVDEEIARLYNEAFRQHRPPTKAVAESLGITVAAAAKRVARIRRLGLLPTTQQGRAAGTGRRKRQSLPGGKPQ